MNDNTQNGNVETPMGVAEIIRKYREMAVTRGGGLDTFLDDPACEALAYLCDALDEQREIAERKTGLAALYKARAEEAEADLRIHRNGLSNAVLTNRIAQERDRSERAEAERDAYKKAKTENDDRFMIERDEARQATTKAETALALLMPLLHDLSWEGSSVNYQVRIALQDEAVKPYFDSYRSKKAETIRPGVEAKLQETLKGFR